MGVIGPRVTLPYSPLPVAAEPAPTASMNALPKSAAKIFIILPRYPLRRFSTPGGPVFTGPPFTDSAVLRRDLADPRRPVALRGAYVGAVTRPAPPPHH